MVAFQEKMTLTGMRIVSDKDGLVQMRCVHCQCNYLAPKGFENEIQCRAPGCLEKRRTQ
jgi:hypothetical protein